MTIDKPKIMIFHRHILRVFLAVLLAGHSVDSIAQATKAILVQNQYFPKAGKEEEVYQWRLHATQVRVKLGLPKGRVLKKLTGNGGPFVIWECEYLSRKDREKDVFLLGKSDEFKKVQAHMSTLLRKFDRFIFEIND